MRSDKQLNPRFVSSKKWSFDRATGGEVRNAIKNPDGSENVWTAFSHSGKESNRLFMNQKGKSFVNVSGLSGADGLLDGRSFVMFDYNRDGKPDLAMVNANKRLLQIFENQSSNQNGFLAVKLRGGEGSNRDAIGAKVTVETSEGKILRVLSCGEGFAAQNSKTLLFGLGSATGPLKLEVQWPSGQVTLSESISPGGLVEISESGRILEVSDHFRK